MEVADAFALAEKSPANTYVLGGERGAIKVPGFHLGNSPLEYTSQMVQGKTVILTTTNGTKATKLAAEGASEVLIGSILNVSAVAKQLFALNRDVALVCAGTRGKLSLEDILAAGMVVRELVRLWQDKGSAALADAAKPAVSQEVYLDEVPLIEGENLVLEDAAVAALRLAECYYSTPLRALYDSLHGQKLLQLGLRDDLAYCSQVDLFDVVPVFKDGKIRL